MQDKIPIHECKHSEKVIAFANSGHNMSNQWWKETFKLKENGELWGVYSLQSDSLSNMRIFLIGQ